MSGQREGGEVSGPTVVSQGLIVSGQFVINSITFIKTAILQNIYVTIQFNIVYTFLIIFFLFLQVLSNYILFNGFVLLKVVETNQRMYIL